jgi:hypothetical protein
MRRTALILVLILPATFALHGQPRHRAVPSNPPVAAPEPYSTPTVDGPWLIEITTSGGITGGGAQRDIRVESNGKLTVGAIAMRGRQCTFSLTPEQTLEAFRVVLNARADLWYASFLPANDSQRCCDLIYVNVHLERQERYPNGGVFQTRYLTEFIPSVYRQVLPSDLVGLYQAIEANFDKYNDQCR